MSQNNPTFLHILSFDVPYPPNYGGVMDVFYKIKTLFECDIKVILHAFHYGRKTAPELEKYCSKVYYYKRKKYINPLIGNKPYIVASRENEELLKNLQKDENPILFEGLHTTFYLDHPSLAKRIKIVRNHNIEHEYYNNLYKIEKSYIRRIFFKKESERLKKYEPILKHANYVLGISQKDTDYLKLKGYRSRWISAFHPNDCVDINLEERGNFIFYHGNLGVAENNHAALYLVKSVFNLCPYPAIIAGSNPSLELRKAIRNSKNITLIDNLSSNQILEHIHQAHINILVTFQATGIKLKLLNSLYKGKHIIVNSPMVENTGLEDLCHIGNNPFELANLIFSLWDKGFNPEEIKNRKKILDSKFSNVASAIKIIDLIKERENTLETNYNRV
jgi:hypothetical protein